MPKWDTVRKRVCVQAGVRGCAMRANRCFAQITAADGTQGVVCMVKPQAAVRSSRSGHFFHTHALREAQRGASRHNNGMSRADENHRACILGEGSGRTSAMPCPDRRMAGPPPLLGLACTHAAWHWPGSGIPSRSVASADLHTLTVGFIGSFHSLIFSIFFVQHVTGPATLVSTSGV